MADVKSNSSLVSLPPIAGAGATERRRKKKGRSIMDSVDKFQSRGMSRAEWQHMTGGGAPLRLEVYRSGMTPSTLQLDRDQKRLEKLIRRQIALRYMERGWEMWNDKIRGLRMYLMRLRNPEFQEDDVGTVFDNSVMIGPDGKVRRKTELEGGSLRAHESTDAMWTGRVDRDVYTPESEVDLNFS